MGVKEEARSIVQNLFGPINAQRVDSMDDSDPIAFLDKVKGLISDMLGPAIAEQNLAALYAKYKR